ncbi:1-acyl-sn-glycerol-3-phosphate acyltransferase epsilon [Hypsibius exemplaris]|uniref:1-acyl-sn-glycerol-3-phosphate acyltransferase epsilon n=1 Tax=Hypsibius exemplaris TaxID=2072580 RepID=A0A1W0WMQ7_HYPEX|nr:1-acyl-sn-glycerol-3-phosphate acyltransferase epsilon [Hypsibius exemplaris]
MLISVLLALKSLPDLVPFTVLLSTAPTFFALWMPFRVVSVVLPRKAYGTADDFTWGLYQRFVLFFFEKLCPVEVIFYGDIDKVLAKKESVLYMSNHQSTVDWIVADMLAVRQGSLGQMRYVLKDGLRFLPLYGYYFYQHDCLYVRRSRKFNADRLQKSLQSIPKYRNRTWLIIFPEGTRFNPNNPAVAASSQAFDRKSGLSALQNVLSPRTKAFHLAQRNLKSYFDAVYDVTVMYSQTVLENAQGGISRGLAPSMNDYMHGAGEQVHIVVKRFGLEELPEEEEETHKWLHGRYVEKDRIMGDFFRDRSVPSGGRKVPLPWLSVLPAAVLFTGLNIALWSTETGRKIYFTSAIGGTAFALTYMGLRKVA